MHLFVYQTCKSLRKYFQYFKLRPITENFFKKHNKTEWKIVMYGKCPEILYTEVSEKMAYTNSTDLGLQVQSDQVYTVCRSTQNFKKQLHKIQNQGKKKRME